MDVRKSQKWNSIFLAGAIFFPVFFLALPVGPGYGMSQIKSLVNRVRPGSFPELEAEKKTKSLAARVTPPGGGALTETEKQILLSLKKRKRFLDQRDLLLNQREEQLRALRDNIQYQVTELKRLQAKIEASMEAKKAQDAKNLNKVVGLYNGMDPKKSAQKLEFLDANVAVKILMAMNLRKASALMEELPPDKAKLITEEFIRKVPATN